MDLRRTSRHSVDMRRGGGLASVAAAVALLGLVGCAAQGRFEVPDPDVQSFRSRDLDLGCVRRVAVLPFGCDANYAWLCEDLTKAFGRELQRAGWFDVVVVTEEDALEVRALRRSLKAGCVEPVALMANGRRWRADAVVVGEITQCRPHRPLMLAFKAEMVATRTGEVLWATDVVYDSQDPRVRAAAERYFQASVAGMTASRRTLSDRMAWVPGWQIEAGPPVEWRSLMLSLNRYMGFVCHHALQSLDRLRG